MINELSSASRDVYFLSRRGIFDGDVVEREVVVEESHAAEFMHVKIRGNLECWKMQRVVEMAARMYMALKSTRFHTVLSKESFP